MKKKSELHLFLGPEGNDDALKKVYQKVVKESVELYIVSAYLTAWNKEIGPLNRLCEHFSFIIGQDFGITRKQACKDVQDWLPAKKT